MFAAALKTIFILFSLPNKPLSPCHLIIHPPPSTISSLPLLPHSLSGSHDELERCSWQAWTIDVWTMADPLAGGGKSKAETYKFFKRQRRSDWCAPYPLLVPGSR